MDRSSRRRLSGLGSAIQGGRLLHAAAAPLPAATSSVLSGAVMVRVGELERGQLVIEVRLKLPYLCGDELSASVLAFSRSTIFFIGVDCMPQLLERALPLGEQRGTGGAGLPSGTPGARTSGVTDRLQGRSMVNKATVNDLTESARRKPAAQRHCCPDVLATWVQPRDCRPEQRDAT